MKLFLTCILMLILALPTATFAAVTTASPELETKAAVLSRAGLNGELLVASPDWSGNFMGLLRQQDRYTLGVYSAQAQAGCYARLNSADYSGSETNKALLWPDRNHGPYGDYNVMFYWLEIPNDVRNADANLGIWRGSTHIVPLYALYDIGNGGFAEPERIFSNSDAEFPMHYHSNLAETRTQELAATALRLAMPLAENMKNSGYDPSNLQGAPWNTEGFRITIYPNSMSGEYQALGPVEVLPPETGDYGMKNLQNLRFVSDTDGVRVSVYYGKTEEDFSFATERRVARVVTRAGQVYEFKAFLGETMPYYRVVAEKGNYVGAWDVMANMRDASELSYIDTRTKG